MQRSKRMSPRKSEARRRRRWPAHKVSVIFRRRCASRKAFLPLPEAALFKTRGRSTGSCRGCRKATSMVMIPASTGIPWSSRRASRASTEPEVRQQSSTAIPTCPGQSRRHSFKSSSDQRGSRRLKDWLAAHLSCSSRRKESPIPTRCKISWMRLITYK